ncbi:MAG: alanine--tRNA ligase [Actinomycetota bacterium]|nr:alanine--tRNA ligase [Actinomycetota bacterium]
MDANGLRAAFTGFFVEHGHSAVASAGLIPLHPRAPLFTNAGMNQFIPYFLGEAVPPYRRATSVQRCVRIRGKHDDIDNVGRTTRHATFFEMLGNFSFGDYFKADAIPFAWELLTGRLGLDPERLWVTVHTSDDEAADIWRGAVGVPADRVQRMGPGTPWPEENFWEMGDTGPCGPCSEIYYDRGPTWGADGGPAGGGEERFCEVWNLVFMQFDRRADGTLDPLPAPCVDTGAGMERLLILLQDVRSIWETDVIRPVIGAAEALTGRRYGDDEAADVALRILADHARSMAFLVSDGVFPTNEDRGYVLRRLIRRAVRFAHQLGVETPVTPGLVRSVAEVMAEAAPELARGVDYVAGVVGREEERFRATLRAGMSILDAELAGGEPLAGEVAFRLHDTFGFPIELTREIAAEQGRELDEEGFARALAGQQQRSREKGKGPATPGSGAAEAYRELLGATGPTRFVGYHSTTATARVLEVLPAGDGSGEVEVFLDLTPFYAEGGGQVGDTGTIETDTGVARVLDTTRALPELTRHRAVLDAGELHPGQVATATVDSARRERIRRNHTGTHLLHWALREVLGSHVRQHGSLVAPDRLRFDFSHYSPMSPEELARVEDLVNAQVLADEEVVVAEMTKAEADASGAIAFFDEKYGERVRVLHAGSRSVELCGGTHVDRLGQIGPFEILSEGSIGSNLRRVEATTGLATLERLRAAEARLRASAELLRTTPEEVVPALERRLAELREAEAAARSARQAALAGEARQLAGSAAAGVVVARRDGLSPEELRDLAVALRSADGVRSVVLGGTPDGSRVALVAAVAPGEALAAPELVAGAARLVGGGGGGRNPEIAQAGGRDVAALDRALDSVRERLAGTTPS